MVGTFALVAATILATVGPTGVTDLRAVPGPPNAKGVALNEAQVQGIAWRLTIPAFNDSLPCNTIRLVPATDSVTYHYQVWGLPIPYVWVLEDSGRYARGDSIRHQYQAWIDKNYVTYHWLSRRTGEPVEYVDACRRQPLLLRLKSYP